MKQIIIWLALVGVISSITPDKNSCKGLNPFLQKLQADGVTIFSSPSKDPAGRCSSEWSSFNTCCESSSLIKYAKVQEQAILKSVENVNNDFKWFLALSKALNTTIFQIAALKEYSWQPLVKDPSQVDKLNKFIDFLHQTVLTRKIFYSFTSDSFWERFVQKNRVCWKRMIEKRNSALCSTCSGRSSIFFKNQKANMGQGVCNDIIDDCWIVFSTMQRYLYVLSGLAFVGNLLQMSNSQYFTLSDTTFFKPALALRLWSKIRPEKIDFYVMGQLFDNNAKLTEEQKKRRDFNARILCEKYISIHGLSWVSFFDEIIDKKDQREITAPLTAFTAHLVNKAKQDLGVEKFNSIVQSLYEKEYNKELVENNVSIQYIESRLKAYNTPGRRLSQRKRNLWRSEEGNDRVLHEELELFEADVNVVFENKVAMVHQSCDSRSIAGIHQAPMNFSLAFP